jgi:phytoene dehydrogenase-like protein
MSDCDAVVIGAGHNGLVAAFYLARAGLDVRVCEARGFVGGGAATEALGDGALFSTCAHMLHAFHPRFVRDMRLHERGLEMLPRRGVWKLTGDGSYWGPGDDDDPRNLTRTITSREQREEEAYGAFVSTLRCLFVDHRLSPPPDVGAMRSRLAGTREGEVLETALTRRVSELHAATFDSPRLRGLRAAEQASVGRDPLALSLAYDSIDLPDPETGEAPLHGYVRGGLGALSRALSEAAEQAGATVELNAPVERLIVRDGRAEGVELANGHTITSRAVLSNLDPKRTLLKLTPADALEDRFRERVGAIDSGVSCMKLLAAVDELPRWDVIGGDTVRPSRGVVQLNKTTERHLHEAHDQVDAGEPPDAPIIHVSVPSAVDETLTNGDGHTVSVWIYPAPYELRDTTWDEQRERVKERMIDQIDRSSPNFRRSIRHSHLRTPADLEAENAMTAGGIWHVSHDGRYLFDQRPLPELAHYRAPVAGLYLGGSGQHPGGEVSGIPGHNAAQQLLRDRDGRTGA